MSAVLDVARNDFRNVRRSRLLWGVAAIYIAFVSLLFYVNGTGQNPAVKQTLFGAVFVTALVLPLVAIAGSYLALAGEREANTARFLLSQPVLRRSVVLGKFLSRTAMLALALGLALLVGLGLVVALYPAVEPVAMAQFVGLTFLLLCAYVSVSVAFSAALSTRSRAIAGTMGFYFMTDILSIVNGFSVETALRILLGDLLGLSISDELYQGLLSAISPVNAYLNSTLAIFSPENFDAIRAPGDLPFYLETWSMILLLVVWIVVPLAVGTVLFDNAEIG